MKKDSFSEFFGKISGLVSGMMVGLIRFYQRFLSPLLPPSCRFIPSCSEYAAQALRKYGPVKGLFRGFFRVIRCNPFCKGGYDPLK